MHLARGGARVLLADKARFPRDKPCGGGLTGRALRHVPCDVSPVVEHDVDRFVVRVGYRGRVRAPERAALIRMTQRRRLDAHLAEQAASAGADFRDGTPVADLAFEPQGASARVGGSPVRASFVVGADGANGIVARAAGLGEGIVCGVALEGNVRWRDLDPGPYCETAWVELGVVPGGYGWVFPKGDHANLGVGGWLAEGPRLRAHIARLARVHGLEPDALTELRGHRLPMRRLGARPRRGARSSSATRRASSIRSRATASTRRSSQPGSQRRRSSPVSRRPTRRHSLKSSTTTPRHPGPRSAPPTGFRASVSGPCARPGHSRRSPGSCAATSGIRARRAASHGPPLRALSRLARLAPPTP